MRRDGFWGLLTVNTCMHEEWVLCLLGVRPGLTRFYIDFNVKQLEKVLESDILTAVIYVQTR